MVHHHPLRDGHPDDSALGDTPLVSLGQGDYRRDIMPGDVSKGHTAHEENRALDRMLADIRRNVATINANLDHTQPTPPARTHDGATDGHVPMSNVRPVTSPVLVSAYERLGRVLLTGSKEQRDAAIQGVIDAAKGGVS